MDDRFIFFCFPTLAAYDPTLLDESNPHHRWFDLIKVEPWLQHFASRVGPLDTPWPLAPTIIPIPTPDPRAEQRFDIVIDSIAEEFIAQVKRSGRRPYVSWSGGIDSAAILVSLLKIADPGFINDLTLLVSDNVWKENPYFYHHHIKDKITCQDIDQFKIDSTNYDKIIIADGEAGNQIMGYGKVCNQIVYYNNGDIFAKKWRDIEDLSQLTLGRARNRFHEDLVIESIEKAPLPIDTVFDYLWWRGFNFRFDEMMMRRTMLYVQHLTAEQSKDFYQNGVYRYYGHEKMQQWSMATRDHRRESWKKTQKFEQKQYIYGYDRNPYWFAFKHQEASHSKSFIRHTPRHSPIFAIDENWKKYSLANSADRRVVGKILGKV